VNVLIATPVEPELVELIRRRGPGHHVTFEPDLLPTPRYPSDHRGQIDFARDEAAQMRWNNHLAGAEIMLGIPAESPPQLADAVARAPRLHWVQCMYAGAGEQIRAANLSPADLSRVTFTTSAGVHGTTLSEFFFMGLLALRKDIRRLERLRVQRSWDHWAMAELYGSTLTIVGMGAIGRAAAKLGRAFGMRILAVTRDGSLHDGAHHENIDATYPMNRLADAVARADAVLLTLPGTDLTEKLFGRTAIAAMKRKAILGNVGRGSVVDQEALVEALQSGAIGGAVLDVFTPEPLPDDHPLWTMENVIFAPHTAALSNRENERVVELFCDNLERFADGQPLRNVVSTAEFY
jgi:phosphoglycerate dehydrogenase-like enzyme